MDTSSAGEKRTRASDVEVPSVSSPTIINGTDGKDGKDLDKAYIYLTQHNNADETVDLKALRRKIDWWIVPIMFACYTMQFIDKVMINVSRISKKSSIELSANVFAVCRRHGNKQRFEACRE